MKTINEISGKLLAFAEQKPVVCIMGPTAAGKTQLSFELCERLGGEVVSVDSALIYRGMDIGTAKPSQQERAAIAHHLIDLCDPSESYSAAEFRQDALNSMFDIYQRGRWPILVGGTMLYFKALLQGLSQLPSTDQAVRESLQQQLEEVGVEALHEKLAKVDKATAKRLHKTDTQRITRALEVFEMTGIPLSDWHQRQAAEQLDIPQLSIALAPQNRERLHQRIEQRFDAMLEAGLLEEVNRLYQRGDLSPSLPSIRCVGYRQLWQYLQGELSMEEARYRAIVATRQLAKRQMTWLRSWPQLRWLDAERDNQLPKVLKFLSLDTYSEPL